jgi:hypothetical protein
MYFEFGSSKIGRIEALKIRVACVSFPDPPSRPGLAVVRGRDFGSFDFTITPSSPPNCVINYIITATSGGGRNITVSAGQVNGSNPVNENGFNVCGANHSFTVAPVTFNQTGPSSVGVPDFQALDQGGLASVGINACSCKVYTHV